MLGILPFAIYRVEFYSSGLARSETERIEFAGRDALSFRPIPAVRLRILEVSSVMRIATSEVLNIVPASSCEVVTKTFERDRYLSSASEKSTFGAEFWCPISSAV